MFIKMYVTLCCIRRAMTLVEAALWKKRRCLDLLEFEGLTVDYIVTDRHPQIQKYLRERNSSAMCGI